MNDAELLTMLKNDLEIVTDFMDQEARAAKDLELSGYLSSAREFITREGIDLTDSYGDSMLLVMYASWLYTRRRAETSYASMPRMLRWNLNNRLYEQDTSFGGNPSAVMPQPTPPETEEDPEQEDSGT